MFITFHTKSAADVTLLKAHAQRILDLLNKDVNRGVITAQESGAAIARLEAEFSYDSHAPVAGARQHDGSRRSPGSKDTQAESLTMAQHAFPFLEMLRVAHQSGSDVLWGV